MAGAAAVGVVSPSMSAVFLPTAQDDPEVNWWIGFSSDS
jgi:hypothetical protein